MDGKSVLIALAYEVDNSITPIRTPLQTHNIENLVLMTLYIWFIFNLALTSTFPKLEIGRKFGLYYAAHKEEIRWILPVKLMASPGWTLFPRNLTPS